MSLTGTFNPQTTGFPFPPPPGNQKVKRPAPFSLRLSAEERARLIEEAKGIPLGAYIRAKVLGSAPPVRMRRTGLAVQDRQALAQVLALLGQSRLSSNLNQLAHAANIGALPLTPETEADLRESLRDVRAMRRLLLLGLGLNAEERP
jgi:hypothetical protein